MQNKDEIIESQKKQIKKLKAKLRYQEKSMEVVLLDRDNLAFGLLEEKINNSTINSQLEHYMRLEYNTNTILTETKKQLELSKVSIKEQKAIVELKESQIEELRRNVNARRGEVLRRELNYYQQDLGRVKSKLLQAKNEVEKLKIRNFNLIGYLELAIKRIAHYMGKSSKYEQETHWNNFKNKNFINQ